MFSFTGLSSEEKRDRKELWQNEGDGAESVVSFTPPYTFIYMFISGIYTFSYL